MILATLADAARYAPLHPLFAEAFRFLAHPDLAQLPEGRHPIKGERLFAIVAKGAARPREEAPLEVHRRYIDIQYVIAGNDEMGWRPLGDCTDPAGAYDEERDLLFFRDAPRAWFTVRPGDYALFLPGDAHAPMTGSGEIHKVVVKVAVE
ncbi:YhcH/YjgK/YiaL family protein [Endothiovibrio diazotrophicus]